MIDVDELVVAASASFAAALRGRFRPGAQLVDIDPQQLGLYAADWVVHAVMATSGTSPVARRVGPVYTCDDLTRWLVAPGRAPLSGEAVRKRAKLGTLVAFHTDDGQWAFPTWQFSAAAGRLIPRTEVIRLWSSLPHDGFLTAADLAAWMNTNFASLTTTPAERAHVAGADDQELMHAVSRLRQRTS